MRITIKRLQEWHACYSYARLKRLFNGKPYLTVLQVLNKKGVPIDDKIWVICHPNVLTLKQIAKCVNEIDKFVKTQEEYDTFIVNCYIRRHRRLKNPHNILINFSDILQDLLYVFSSRKVLALLLKALERH